MRGIKNAAGLSAGGGAIREALARVSQRGDRLPCRPARTGAGATRLRLDDLALVPKTANKPGSPATILALVTAVLSNLINNSAAVMLLLKVIDPAHPATAYILALANSFGGSLIILGSVSNIIVVQQARALGIKISFRDFARLGVPVTLAALAGLLVGLDNDITQRKDRFLSLIFCGFGFFICRRRLSK